MMLVRMFKHEPMLRVTRNHGQVRFISLSLQGTHTLCIKTCSARSWFCILGLWKGVVH